MHPDALRMVTSTARSSHFDAAVLVCSHADVHVAQERVEPHLIACLTEHARQRAFHLGGAFLCTPRGSNRAWHPLHVASVMGTGRGIRSNSKTRNRCGRTQEQCGRGPRQHRLTDSPVQHVRTLKETDPDHARAAMLAATSALSASKAEPAWHLHFTHALACNPRTALLTPTESVDPDTVAIGATVPLSFLYRAHGRPEVQVWSFQVKSCNAQVASRLASGVLAALSLAW